MGPLPQSLALWLAHTALGGAALLLITLLLMRWTRQPARRQRLGELGVAAALLMAVLALGPAWWTPPWVGEPEESASASKPFLEEPLAFQGAIVDMPLEMPFVPADFALDAGLEELPPPAPDVATPMAAPFPWHLLAAWLVFIVMALFALGACLFLLRWLLGLAALWRIINASCPAPPSIRLVLRQLLSGNRTPRVLVTDRLRVPVSFGLFRPTILLPASLCGPNRTSQLRWVFAHEWAHLERRDAWSALLFALGQAMFFYLPWFWQVRRQVRLCQEFVADAAAAQDRPADEYAEFLLSWAPAPAIPLAASGVSGNQSDLYRRVTMLLSNGMSVEKRCPRGWVATIGLGLLALAVVIAGVSLTANADDRIIIIKKAAGKDGQDVIQVLPATPGQEIRDVIQVLPGQGQAQPGKKVIVLQGTAQPAAVRVQAKPAQTQKKEVIVIQGTAQPQQGARVQATPKTRVAGQNVVVPNVDVVVPNVDVKELEIQLRAVAEQKVDVDAIQKAIEKLEKLLSAQELEQVRKALEQLKQMKQWRHMIPVPPKTPDAVIAPAKPGDTTWTFVWPQQPRLGLKLSKPSAILADQLNLPKGQGLVITEVTADSAAAKAGLKANDILMKVGDILVADDVSKFTKALEGLKAGSTVVAWVLRRGKEETIRGLKVPEAGARVRFPQNIQLNP
ncbi:MAG: PDZ domain-containing protein, partial [Gemmataceae bacterium]|nr:PDZ domain-containing protein [Gemmataceae bacterium]